MPSPHAHAHPPVSASAASLPASAYNFHLNTASTSNLSSTTFSNSNSSPTSRATTPASQITIGSSRKPHQQKQYYDSSVSSGPVSRAYYGSASAYPNTNESSHISSAADLTPSQPAFFPSSLPRTSSLLPPPRITVNENNSWKQPALYDPFNAPVAAAAVSAFADPVNDRDFLDDSVSPKNTRRRASKSHSRSSSLGGLSDSFRNLNRWSISTASSRASNANSTKNRFSRRMSIDSTGLFSQPNPVVSPRRLLQKNRPSTAGASPEERRPSIPQLTTLPPIVHLPSLEQEDFETLVFSNQESQQDRTTYFPASGAEDNSGRFCNDSNTAHESSYLSTSARATLESSLPTSAFSRDATMPRSENAGRERGHTRSRSQGLQSSTDSTSSPRNVSRSKQPSQKAMLSKALQKANTAVQLDNGQNFEGARAAYQEACDLLQQVLLRTSGDEDKKKLEAIRTTYSSRIEELDQMLPQEAEDDYKALPQRPESSGTDSEFYGRNDSVVDGSISPARSRSNTGSSQPSQQTVPNYARPTSAAWRPQMSRHSPKPSIDGPRYVATTPTNFNESHNRSQSVFSQISPKRNLTVEQDMFLARPMEDEYMPPPLSPRRPKSPTKQTGPASPGVATQADFSSNMNHLAPELAAQRGHQRMQSHESISWLDPIDESGASSASSVHSRSSSMGVRRKHIRATSGDTEAEFDAALDDAIEAAYDDGYEPVVSMERNVNLDHVIDEDDVIAQALRKVQLAKERVRQSELEMQRLASDRDRRLRALQEEEEQTLPGGFYNAGDSDEEERILEGMTDGHSIDEFALGDEKKGRLPRESDSSELTSRTWQSSTVSNPPTANTVLSAVTESTSAPSIYKSQGPLAPPPTQSLPKLPDQRPPPSAGRDSVRDRRLSGQNAKQLKIDTQKLGSKPKVLEPATAGPTLQNPELPPNNQPKTAGFITQQRQGLSAGPTRASSIRRGPSPIPPGLAVDATPPTPSVPANFQDLEVRAASPSVSRPPALRKNFSSNSLKTLKSRNLSISNNDEFPSEISPNTPLSNQFGNVPSARLPAVPALPTPVASAFRDRIISGSATGGLYLFESDIHTPMPPGEPDATSEDAPVPLEPCPTDVMLRPFWLMRALYQTLAHPKGGYISNKLFVPRDAWRVKGVKIKGMEDKISQCDLLTAALQKLARVNSEDADAVLEEMQSLENVLEQAQNFLTRRLGNDVGVQSSFNLFRDADGVIEGADGKPTRNNSVAGGKGAFSWRRLRTKTSSTGMGSTYERASRKDLTMANGADAMSLPLLPTLPTLPMTNNPTAKTSKRDVMAVQYSGPNAHYMASLARLFDAAQTIDQIARQVEDPGLRHADKTQVGLELCTRHAAEFFGFYICRFVLQDLTMLLDKFIKRGSEWVLV